MADEPSIPMDQEEEDNDEYFSARETQKKGSKENLLSSTPTPGRSDRDASPAGSSSGKQTFFSDEKAQQGSENSTKKSEKVRRMLKDQSRWDMIEYKKEELDKPPSKPKKKKKKKAKTKKVKEAEEKSKTDEESEEKEETKETPVGSSPSSDRVDPEPRDFFQSEQLIFKCKTEKPIAPKCKFGKLKFAKNQDVVEYDAEGSQHLQPACNERAISNPWRRWGAHRALCDQGGYLVDKNKKIVEIKRGSDPPRCPPNPRQVTLNKNNEAPNSQTMMGTLKVEVGSAEDEVHRIGLAMEEYVRNGGFVPPPMTKKEIAARPPKGQPVVVVQAKGGGGNQPKDASGAKGKPKQRAKNSKPAAQTPKKSSASEADEGTCEDESQVEKKRPDDSKKRFGFFKRNTPQKPKTKEPRRNNKGSTR